MNCIDIVLINNLFVTEIIKKYEMPPVELTSIGDYSYGNRTYAIFKWRSSDDAPLCVGCCSDISEAQPLPEITLSIPFTDDIASLTDEQIRDKASKWLFEKVAF